MLVLKCNKCHHEKEGYQKDAVCSWCGQGHMKVIAETPEFDATKFLDDFVRKSRK